MIKHILLSTAILAVLLASSAEASVCVPTSSPTPCLGKTCSSLGETTMDNDQQNIIACLKNTTGDLVWKSMQGSSSVFPKNHPVIITQSNELNYRGAVCAAKTDAAGNVYIARGNYEKSISTFYPATSPTPPFNTFYKTEKRFFIYESPWNSLNSLTGTTFFVFCEATPSGLHSYVHTHGYKTEEYNTFAPW